MKRLVLCFSFLSLTLCSALCGQEPARRAQPQPVMDVMPTPTEDMWFYLQQQQRYDDPQTMIRRREEQKAEQRRLRIATMKWFGFSKARPLASHTPWTGAYSAMWMGTVRHPYHWVGGGSMATSIRLDVRERR